MQIPLLRGRFFTDADNEHWSRDGGRRKLCGAIFPGPGSHRQTRALFAGVVRAARTDEIVGIVGHIKQFGLQPDKTNNVEAEFYEPFQQTSDSIMRRVGGGIPAYVRVADGVDPESVFPSIRRSLTQLDSQMVVDDMQSMSVWRLTRLAASVSPCCCFRFSLPAHSCCQPPDLWRLSTL